jgi:hypothetical protein
MSDDICLKWLFPQGIGVDQGKAAEKRQTAETACRFSGIAALPLPAKPRFTGLFELACRLLSLSYEKSGHPKVSRHEHQLR